MLISSLAGGITTRARANQSAPRIGAASGSDSVAFSISLSVSASARSQSLQSGTVDFSERLIVRLPFMRCCSPGRDYAAYGAAVRVDHNDLMPVQDANGDDALLVVLESLVRKFENRPIEDELRRLEIDTVIADVLRILLRVPFE